MIILNINEISQYWVTTSSEDYKVMLHLLEKKDYAYALFFGHLLIEKLLKAVYCAINQKHAPYKHNLVSLAQEAHLEISENQQLDLEAITRFNIEARYPDLKLSFYNLCTKEFTEEYVKKIEDLRKWLLTKI